MKKSFLITCATLLLLTIAQSCFAYKISTSGKTITVKMKHPTIGIIGVNQVGWEDNPVDIEKDIYDLFTGPLDSQKTGNYTIKVYWQREDHYGNTSSTYAGSFSISADELKKYRLYISKADGAAGQIGQPIPARIIGKIEIGNPGTACSRHLL